MALFEDIVFPWINDVALGARFEPLRAKVASGARGRVLEIGAGTGLNFKHYPRDARVTAVEPAGGMRRRAARLGRIPSGNDGPVIDFIEGRAKELPFDAGSFDTVVLTFTLCSIREKGISTALSEIKRVLVKGGEVRIAEHVKSRNEKLARVQARIEPVWNVLFAGCSLLRDPRRELDRAGFEVTFVTDVELPMPRIVSEGQIGFATRP